MLCREANERFELYGNEFEILWGTLFYTCTKFEPKLLIKFLLCLFLGMKKKKLGRLPFLFKYQYQYDSFVIQ